MQLRLPRLEREWSGNLWGLGVRQSVDRGVDFERDAEPERHRYLPSG